MCKLSIKKFRVNLRNLRNSIILLSAVILSACDMVDNTIQGHIGSTTPADFLNTEIVAGGPTPADGTSQLLVAIHLKNSNNSSVPLYKPTYSVTAGSAVQTSDCTTSDNNGVSVCILKATAAGTKTIALTNALVGLSKNVIFTASEGIQRMNIVSSGAVNATTPQGSLVQLSVGNPIQGVNHTTAGGYKVQLSLQGISE